MCFSAEASFGAGAVLSAVGIAAITKTSYRAELPFACVPLIFGIQQFTEGFVWLGLQNTAYAHLLQPAIFLFLIFAQVVWPSWVPISILLLEKNHARKRVLRLLSATGLLVSLFLAFRLFTQDVTASVGYHHILYHLGFTPAIMNSFGILYFIATVIPAFLSSVRKMYLLGLSVLLSYIVTKIFFENYVISVWCFFAAILSVMVLSILVDQKRAYRKSLLIS